jgi:excisionase family DNA binding protein
VSKNKSQERLSSVNGNGRRRYVNIQQAADYIGVNPATIRAMHADGRLTRYQLGPRIIRVDLNEIDALMAGETGGAA